HEWKRRPGVESLLYGTGTSVGWAMSEADTTETASLASGEAPVRIFISYRRDDTGGWARHVHDRIQGIRRRERVPRRTRAQARDEVARGNQGARCEERRLRRAH